jgi:hypothetical protein
MSITVADRLVNSTINCVLHELLLKTCSKTVFVRRLSEHVNDIFLTHQHAKANTFPEASDLINPISTANRTYRLNRLSSVTCYGRGSADPITE